MRCDRVEVFGCQLGKMNSSENFRAFFLGEDRREWCKGEMQGGKEDLDE